MADIQSRRLRIGEEKAEKAEEEEEEEEEETAVGGHNHFVV